MVNESQPQRRSLLTFGGGLGLAPLVSGVTGTSPGGRAVAAQAGASAAFRWPTLSREPLTYSVPAADWQSQVPIGNGRPGAMLCADPHEERISTGMLARWKDDGHVTPEGARVALRVHDDACVSAFVQRSNFEVRTNGPYPETGRFEPPYGH
ncbi:glycoside hydrolase N-terminal domain-containing protein [Streptomyces massasporeus]|uniref:glycoside hydrolase N-terminal domain-containing protein n=1 Tax=Streptomyces massasporeus TaxID=67324 RepID=UPI003408BC55